MADLNEKEIVVESRVLFRLDFPALVKSLGIKARPNKPFLDILKPLLKRYNFTTVELEGVKLVLEKDASELWAKDLESAVAADFDNDRITVLKIQPDLDIPFVDSEETTPPPYSAIFPNVSGDSRDLSSEDATMNSGKGDEDNEEDESLMDGNAPSSGDGLGESDEKSMERSGSKVDDDASPGSGADGLERRPYLSCATKTQSEEMTGEPLSPSLRRGAKVTSV